MTRLTCLTHTVYVLTDDARLYSPAPCAIREATRADVDDPAVRLGCLVPEGVVPLSAYEREHMVRGGS